MTKTSKSHLFAKALLAASALTVLAAAPAAFAVPAVDTKLSSAKQTVKHVKLADNDHRSHNHRGDRSRARSNRGHRANRGHRSDRRRRGFRSDRGFRSNRRFSSNNRFRSNRGFRSNQSYRRNVSYNRGYTPYRSNIGISFNFSSPRYSGYRWAPTAYSFYQPSYGAYSAYQTNTVCRRITTEAYHHGHRELISVKQCSNPYDGTYIIQGSERLIDCRW